MMYQKTSSYLGFASAIKLKTLLFLLWISVLAPLTASAVVVEGLFEVKMPVLDESKAIRRAALDDGLIEVLIRVSGDSNILEKIKAPAAGSYVKRYEYLVKPAVEKNGSPSQQLWVRYNSTRVLDFLRQQAIPIWGDRRVQAVVWLAVHDGSQRYILKNHDVSLIKDKAETAFGRRGIPAIWPENDAVDRQAVRFSDIWAGFVDPLKQASKRYSSGPVIAATMGWDGQMWKGEWSLLMGDEVTKWSLRGQDYANLIVKATDSIADVMGKKFAVLETFDVSQQKSVAVEVDRVKDVEDFRRVEKYLSSLSAVQSVQLSQVGSDRVFFDLTLRSEVDDLLNLIKSGSVIELLVDDVANELKSEAVITNAPEKPVINITGSVPPDALLLKPAPYRFVLR